MEIEALVEARYGALFPTLNLPPESLARLRLLLFERQQVTIDAANAALVFGMNPVRELAAIQAGIERFQKAIDTTLREEFGEKVSATLRDHDRFLPERNTVEDFVQSAVNVGEPLDPDQQKQLMQILTRHSGPGATNLEAVIYGGLNQRAEISAAAITEAAVVLSPSQIELLRTFASRARDDR
jgi:hypothetical protein